jgi:multiple antibiotic resistance protein
MTKDLNPMRHHLIIFREMLIALGIMIGFYFLGDYVLDFLKLSESSVRLASGLILFLIAIKILFPSQTSLRANLPKGEPFIFPLAVPLIAGPGLMATIMLFSNLESSRPIMLPAIVIAWLASVIILYFSGSIKRLLGNNGLMASERLIGMVLVLLSVQRFLEGILVFWAQEHPK